MLDFFAEQYPHSYIYIHGKDAENFLQGQLTCDVKQLERVSSIFAAYCNNQGRVINIASLSKYLDGYLIHLPGDAGSDFCEKLRKFAIFSKIVIEDITKNLNTWLIYSENNLNQLKEQLQQLLTDTCYKVESIAKNGLKIYAASDPTGLTEKLQNLNYQLRNSWWNYPYLINKIPVIYRNTVQKFLPHPLGLPELGAISFTKGCYLGQEIIARTQYLGKVKKHLEILAYSTELNFQPGEEISDSGTPANSIVVDKITISEQQQLLLALVQLGN